MQFMTNINQHVSALWCHPEGVYFIQCICWL